jgi:O-antigen ligase
VCAFSLALTPLNTNLAGLAWLMFCLFCFANAWRNQLAYRRVTNNTPYNNPLLRAATIWLLCCSVATVLRIIPQALWHDDWGRRHAEARLLIVAVSLYLGLKFSQRFSNKSLLTWLGACWVACASGFATTLWLDRDTPSHPIAWAVSLSFIICLILPYAMTWCTGRGKALLWLGISLGIAGVLMSQSRGAYGIVLWAVWILGFSQHTQKEGFALNLLLGLGTLGALLVWACNDPQDGLRIQEFMAQWAASSNHLVEGVNSSVGARLFLWQKAWIAIQAQPILGYGAESTVLQIETWGRSIESAEVMRLGHLHNEFLDAWMTHGVLGLLSCITYGLGLSWMCWTLRKSHPNTTLMLLGILWMHVSASMSNVNLAHNYYGTVLALCIGLALWLGQHENTPHA